MTNHWIDLQNADVILVSGANPAENHPISMKWVERAMDKGAKLISVDPRFTRTASKADIYARLRPGTDIAFFGGLINYALEKGLFNHDYVAQYTNASFLINESYSFSSEEGVFCGLDEEGKVYDKRDWAYQTDDMLMPLRDMTLEHPNCVFQLMKKHYSRYTVDMVADICGTDKEAFVKVADTFCSTFADNKSAVIMYAMGTTQSTHGSQNVRSYAMLQLLLGNVGNAGGGIAALRGESNVQGSTDYALLYHILPGYLKAPEFKDVSLQDYLAKETPKTSDPQSANWWSNRPKYLVSLLKAFWGDHATAENDFCYDYLPKRSGNYSYIPLMQRMHAGEFEGMVCMGTNPAVGGPDSTTIRDGLGKLKWLVCADLWETETSIFWKRPGTNPADIQTEVFLLPAASSVEKEGSVSNSGRWAQWRYQAVKPVGDSIPDLDMLTEWVHELKELYKKDGGALPAAITELSWNYGEKHPEPEKVAKEINGFFTRDVEMHGKLFKKGDQVPSFAMLQADGSTCSGNWLYCNSYPAEDKNLLKRRGKEDPTGLGMFHNWAWCWPVNRRILYNRASVHVDGTPRDPSRAVVAWDAVEKKWKGDIPDGGWAPLSEEGGKAPFIMNPEGYARLFAATMADGPFPEHYEPFESPARNLLGKSQSNPVVKAPAALGQMDKYPCIGTTYRVTEHWQAGAMTRNLEWLNEMVPSMFCEISDKLAAEKGIKHGEMVIIESARGAIEAFALVSTRIKPFIVEGKEVEQVGMVWHFGYAGKAKGDSANILTPMVGCANTTIPEFKAFLCNIRRKG